MADIIIILIVIILLGLALKGSIKHFKGEGPCCGGGSGSNKKAKTKFLDCPVIGRNGITAKVNLKDNSAEVSYDREIDLTDLKNAVKKAGYEVTSIS